MPDYDEIYHQHADQYDLLVSREDYQHNLFRMLNQINSFDDQDVVEFGAGTGRLTCMLAPVVRTIRAFDSSQHMLELAVQNLKKTGSHNWQVEVCDHRNVMVQAGTADVAISGWSICYLVVGNKDTWQKELSRGLAEMHRVLREDGSLIIIETLGTGYETPAPPQDLVEYYGWLEASEFQRSWGRTDYLFQNMEEAQSLTRFFFGDEMAQKITSASPGILLPECTGIWWRKRNLVGI